MKVKELAGLATFRLLVFPVIMVVLLSLIAIDNWQLISGSKNSVIYTYIASFTRGEIGSGYGTASTDQIIFAGLEPGDILLGGWSNCAYGHFSHAGLYVGDNKVIEGYVDYGLSVQESSHYMEYPQICFLRVEASREVKDRAVAYALAHEGQMFYPVAFKQGERYWNCSKIIWEAYYRQGIDLDAINDLWIAPEGFCSSPRVQILYEKGI